MPPPFLAQCLVLSGYDEGGGPLPAVDREGAVGGTGPARRPLLLHSQRKLRPEAPATRAHIPTFDCAESR